VKKNLFWTGGFDSTYRLLQLIQNSSVEEIDIYYLAFNIDNVDYEDIKRRSIDFEIQTMNLLLNFIDTKKIKSFYIFATYTKLIEYSLIFNFNFMKYQSMDRIEISDKNKLRFFDLYCNQIVLRPISQWTSITQVLDDLSITAEICLEKGGGIWSKLQGYYEDGILHTENLPCLSAFERYEMPLFDVDREEMVVNSLSYGWNSILEKTWSCWYPKNGQICGNCFACKHRPILLTNPLHLG
jgi:hypothetical protein